MEREPEKCEDEMGKQWMPRLEKGDDGGNELQKIEGWGEECGTMRVNIQ